MIRALNINALVLLGFGWLAAPCCSIAADATFLRAVNLNGPALEVDGRPWEGGSTTNLVVQGKTFENQAVALRPATDVARARMIRSSVWGSSVDVELTGLPARGVQVVLYVWEDTISEQFDLLVNNQTVARKFHSGTTGSWRKLGPWKCAATNGTVKVSARAASHGAANLSGIEIWADDGTVPQAASTPFVTVLTSEHTEFFERRIRPLLVDHCHACHSADAKKLKGGLMLDSRAGIIRGGDTGAAVTPGDPEASLLIQAVRHADPDLAMPPGKQLPPEAIADLEAWVRMGAPDPRVADTAAEAAAGAGAGTGARTAIDWPRAREWWSFRPLTAPPIPTVKDSGWPAGDLDRFILARLEEDGLKPAAAAGKRVLIRRATFDLLGLPPTPDEVDAFLADESPEAFPRVVDRLLASPHYGERWGRHWLDVVRYADTAGDNSDFPIPQMHLYRDWVIRAFNRDMPYDRFVRDQLAGDLLPAASEEERQDRLIATGYIANARRFGSRVDDYPQHLTIEDTIDNVGRAFLGLTVSCARCHDHKFDPIPAADYYALYGFFQSTRYPWPGIELEQRQRDLVPLVEASRLGEAEALRKTHDAEKRRLDKALQALKDSLKDKSGDARKDVEACIRDAERAVTAHVEKGLPFGLAYAVADAAEATDAVIQLKGDPAKPGDVVARRFLTVLGGQPLPSTDRTSGRLHLAAGIADAGNPLTARVMVNRIWLHHFGRGLVPTPNDFGRQGKPPTHPSLLDWLATRFIDAGWSVKAMHRLIMLSRTYSLSGDGDAEAAERDPNHERFGSFPRRRLDAESLRDTLLVLGGNLDTSPPGPHPFPPQSEWKFTQHNPFKAVYDSKRRSVYLMTQRIQRHPYLAIFDGADPSASTAVRTASTTPLQALYLLNDRFVHDQSREFATRILSAAGTDPERIGFAYRSALGRPVEPAELADCQAFLHEARRRLADGGTATDGPGAGAEAETEASAWQAMVRALFRLNEFMYTD